VIALVKILEKHLRIAERKVENKNSYSFYLELLAMHKSGKSVNEETIKRENELRKTLQFFLVKR